MEVFGVGCLGGDGHSHAVMCLSWGFDNSNLSLVLKELVDVGNEGDN